MPIDKRKCLMCRSEFYGSTNKLTCSDKCRMAKSRRERKERMYTKTHRARHETESSAVAELEENGFIKSRDNRWIKRAGNGWADIEQHVSGKGFVIQYGVVCL